jgi:hypothetical protein
LFSGETWKEATPGILRGISIACAVAAAVGTFGILAVPTAALSTMTIGSATISAGGLTTASLATSIATDELMKANNFIRIYQAYQQKEISGEEARNLAGYNVISMLASGVAPNFLTPIGGAAVSQSMDVGFEEMLENYKRD